MPIQLPPLSRRAFLRRALLTGAGLAAAPHLLAAAMRRTAATSFALLADLHIAADPAKRNGNVNMTDHLSAVVREIISLPQRAAGAFLVGDCAYSSGAPGEYAQVAKLLDPLRVAGLPLHFALGNHDHREHFWAAITAPPATQRPVPDKQVALIKSQHVNWFLLDSLEKTLQTPGALVELT